MDKDDINTATCCDAATWNDQPLLDELIAAGADVNAPDENGWSPAIHACFHGHPQSLAQLIAAGCDIEAMNPIGWSAATAAATYGHEDCLAQLLAAGCKIEFAPKPGAVAINPLLKYGTANCIAMIEAELERRILAAATGQAFPAKQALRV